jgi:hypothetical protein
MAQYQITVDQEILHQLFLGERDAGVAKLLESVLNQVLQAQVTEQIGAKPYDRKGYRNGSYSRSLTTRVGTINLRIPCIREGQFSTELFARYQRSEQALVLALMEMIQMHTPGLMSNDLLWGCAFSSGGVQYVSAFLYYGNAHNHYFYTPAAYQAHNRLDLDEFI